MEQLVSEQWQSTEAQPCPLWRRSGYVGFAGLAHGASGGVTCLIAVTSTTSRRSTLGRTTDVMIDCERPGARSESASSVARDEGYDRTTLAAIKSFGAKRTTLSAWQLREPGGA